MKKAKEQLIKELPDHIEVRRFLFKDRGYSALLYSPGIYMEPPAGWDVYCIDFEKHEIWIKISFDKLNLN